MSGPCRSAVSRAVMSVLQARHEGPGLEASKIRTKGSFLYGENGNFLGFSNSVSNQPSQQVQRYRATGEPFPAALSAEPRNRFQPNDPENLRLAARAGTPEARFHRGIGGGKGTGK
jgi:hypothetical protein